MHRTIDFPNLGIHLKSVGDHITVFGFDIAYYGIVIGIGILAGLMMAVMEAKRTHQNIEDYYDLAIYGVIFSIIGARAYYVIFSWDMYKDDIKSIINIREGGLAIYGGVITAIVVVFIFAKIKGLSPFLLFDTGGFGLITGQMIGRWGNFFNREAFVSELNSVLFPTFGNPTIPNFIFLFPPINSLISAYLFLQVDHLVGHYFLFPNQSTNLAEYNPVLSWVIPLPSSLPFKSFPIFQLLS